MGVISQKPADEEGVHQRKKMLGALLGSLLGSHSANLCTDTADEMWLSSEIGRTLKRESERVEEE